MDITRALLKNIGVELVWLPMNVWNSPPKTNYSSLAVSLAPTDPPQTVATTCPGYISGTTLTIIGVWDRSPGGERVPVVHDKLHRIRLGHLHCLGTGSEIPAYTVNRSQTVGSSEPENKVLSRLPPAL